MSRSRPSPRPTPEQRTGKDFHRKRHEWPVGRAERRPYRHWSWYAKDRETWEFVIVSVDELRELTGLEPEHVLQFSGAERMTRELPDGRREEALKVPREFVATGFS